MNHFVCSSQFIPTAAPRARSRSVSAAACVRDVGSSALVDFVGSGVSVMIVETVLDGSFTRFSLLVTAPLLFCISLVREFLSYQFPVLC